MYCIEIHFRGKNDEKTFLAVLIVMFSSIALFAVEKDDIVGLWFMPEDDAGEIVVVEIFEQGGKYYAVSCGYKSYENTNIERVKPSKDVNNPDPSLRNRTLDEVIIVNEISFNGKKWDDGEIYDPSVGKYFYLSGTIKDGNLVWKATIDKAGVFAPKITWTRVENVNIYESLRKTQAELEALIPNKRYK